MRDLTDVVGETTAELDNYWKFIILCGHKEYILSCERRKCHIISLLWNKYLFNPIYYPDLNELLYSHKLLERMVNISLPSTCKDNTCTFECTELWVPETTFYFWLTGFLKINCALISLKENKWLSYLSTWRNVLTKCEDISILKKL